MKRLILTSILVLGLGAGCSGPNGGASTLDTLSVLERGKATGELEVTVSGSPLSLNNTISVGPTGAVHFKGQVDFSSPLEQGRGNIVPSTGN